MRLAYGLLEIHSLARQDPAVGVDLKVFSLASQKKLALVESIMDIY